VTEVVQPTLRELVDLGAVDYRLFCKAFFPRTFRDDFPDYSDRLWDPLDSRAYAFINYQIFRGGSKTTTVRGFIAKRIAYALSRTIMIVCASSDKAEKTIRWLKGTVTRNQNFANAFQLKKGAKWSDVEIEIIHGVAGHSIHVVGYGITGNVRGINIDDYRPGFIVVDDVINEENSATKEGRKKVEDLLLGAVANTLAPATEEPDAKMVLLQTPFQEEDASMQARKDPQWITVRQPCWTLQTEMLPIEHQRSAWESRFPTESLRAKKLGHIARNVASLWAREFEVRLVSAENTLFLREWLKVYEDYESLPIQQMYTVISIDPVPPPSEVEMAKGLYGKNFEAISVIGYAHGKYFLLEYRLNRGHDPSWTIATIFELAFKWRVQQIVVETINYQKTLSWLIQQAMQRRRHYIPILEDSDKRAKRDKIVQGLKGPTQHGQFYVHASMGDFIEAFANYTGGSGGPDDLLDSVAMGVRSLTSVEIMDELSEGSYGDNDNADDLVFLGAAP
jgi:terminase large subunit-like protein